MKQQNLWEWLENREKIVTDQEKRITDQVAKIEEAFANQKPQKLIDSYEEEYARLVTEMRVLQERLRAPLTGLAGEVP